MKWYSREDNDGSRVFVFGSNLAGRHGAGAAKDAVRYWGAQRGVGHGPTGYAYAIPTKDANLRSLPISTIGAFVKTFLRYAASRPDLEFLITKVGCGLAGYTVQEIAPFFLRATSNCKLPSQFQKILKTK